MVGGEVGGGGVGFGVGGGVLGWLDVMKIYQCRGGGEEMMRIGARVRKGFWVCGGLGDTWRWVFPGVGGWIYGGYWGIWGCLSKSKLLFSGRVKGSRLLFQFDKARQENI